MESRWTSGLLGFLVVIGLTVPELALGRHGGTAARSLPPLVTTEWLAENNGAGDFVILDVRSTDAYQAGHIPGAVNVPTSGNWFIMTPELWLEMPPVEDLFHTIGSAGIPTGGRVVVVGAATDSFALADTTRAALALLYAGLVDVALLDGGHDKWASEGRPLSDVIVEPESVLYEGTVNQAMLASKEYVERRLHKSVLIDARTPEIFFGVAVEPWALRPGHIPGARSLPTPWLWTEDGVYQDHTELEKMARGVIGRGSGTHREIIAYCGVGGYGATAYFVLHEILGYRRVKLYDGSAQEWVADPEAPLVKYRW